MGRSKGEAQREVAARGAGAGRTLVYKPCPVCWRAVALADETRVADDPETYECQRCGARFALADSLS